MRVDEAVEALPPAYVQALRLAVTGATDEEIATAVGVADESVVALLRLGISKLGSILACPAGAPPATG